MTSFRRPRAGRDRAGICSAKSNDSQSAGGDGKYFGANREATWLPGGSCLEFGELLSHYTQQLRIVRNALQNLEDAVLLHGTHAVFQSLLANDIQLGLLVDQGL